MNKQKQNKTCKYGEQSGGCQVKGREVAGGMDTMGEQE